MTNLGMLGDPSKRKRIYNPDLAEQLNREVELQEKKEKLEAKRRKERGETMPPETNPPQPPQDPVTSSTDFWTISRVIYRGQAQDIELAKSLLLNEETHTQDQWSQHYETAIQSGQFHSLDYPLFYGIIKALKEQNAEESRDFIKKQARAKWLMTLTRVRYMPTNLDEIIHNYKTRDKYEKQVDFITKDGLITKTGKPESYQALLDTADNVQEINGVFRWLNGTDAYALKINAKPDTPTERVASFYAGSDRAYISCGRYAGDADASLGVRFVRAKK